MHNIISLNKEVDFKFQREVNSDFILDVKTGLTKVKKQIQSKYFYDEYGCELFNQITRHPDYYLTHCELEILNTYKKELSTLISTPFNLIELGPGEGIKTQILVEAFLQKSLNFRYIPIDISKKYLSSFIFPKEMSAALKITPIHADFFRGIEWLKANSKTKNLVLFLGSSIGNFNPTDTMDFLRHLAKALNQDDYVLLGFDLKKDVHTLIRAYNDYSGITSQFNLNILRRINRELDADFNLDKFLHYATYNVYSGAMESYLISLERQSIRINAAELSCHFEAVEPIHVECSFKYSLRQIEKLAQDAGFKVIHHFSDDKKYFVDALWQVHHQ